MEINNTSTSPEHGIMKGHGAPSETAPPPGEAAAEQQYPTWVRTSLVPGFREQAPSLDQLCTTLIASLDGSGIQDAIIADEKPSNKPITAATNGVQNKEAPLDPTEIMNCAPEDKHQALPKPGNLNKRLCEICPDFTTYTDLEALHNHPDKEIHALATRIRAIFLTWMEEERVAATWVTPNILLDGMLGSLDAAALRALCAAHAFAHVAMVSIHPDDWVVGGAWAAHGQLAWTRRPASAQEQERAHGGIAERLVAPWRDRPPARRPGVIVQSGVALRSPVADQLVIPLEDGAGASLLVHLPDICTFMAAHDRPDTLVVLNCKMGLSRSHAAQEAFVLRAVSSRLRQDAAWRAKGAGERQGDLLRIVRNYHEAFGRRRADLKDKFPRQMESWARFLAEGEPECGPDFATDKVSAGGEGMRDAAVVACYQVNCLLPESLVAHYYKRTGTGKGSAYNTVVRFRRAEEKLRADLESDVSPGSTAMWLSLNDFVDLCRSTHQSGATT